MNDLTAIDNAPAKVFFRQWILALEAHANKLIETGEAKSNKEDIQYQHFFAPAKTGGFLYARAGTLPVGSLVFGEIHKDPCINILLKGVLLVRTENGIKRVVAPDIFVTGRGIKKIGYVEEEAFMANIHLTETNDPEKVEEELAAKTYEELGLIASVEKLKIGE